MNKQYKAFKRLFKRNRVKYHRMYKSLPKRKNKRYRKRSFNNIRFIRHILDCGYDIGTQKGYAELWYNNELIDREVIR